MRSAWPAEAGREQSSMERVAQLLTLKTVMLEDGYDWYVRWLDLNPRSLSEAGFLKMFAAWRGKVMKYQAERFPQMR